MAPPEVFELKVPLFVLSALTTRSLLHIFHLNMFYKLWCPHAFKPPIPPDFIPLLG